MITLLKRTGLSAQYAFYKGKKITTVKVQMLLPFVALLLLPGNYCFAQNETAKWYFGEHKGIDFMSNPPAIIPNVPMWANEGSASISDTAGTILFYTDGDTVYNKNNAVMVNGTGLFGNFSATQSALIVKKPGSSGTYYIFTQDAFGHSNGLCYSVVDMTQASGMGAVTAKNIQLHTPSCEKLAAVKHCNGVDVWLVSHDYGSDTFRSYLVTAAGVNSVSPAISNIGPSITYSITAMGPMKISPDGKKLGFLVYDVTSLNHNATPRPVEIFDFDASTGLVSNRMSLQSFNGAYGCEFSPDGTKFYVSSTESFAGIFSPFPVYYIFQWDLCAGSATAVANSIYTITIPSSTGKANQMQLAKDGKIYIAKSIGELATINKPNLAGAACNYSNSAITFTTYPQQLTGIPNFMSSLLKPASPAFTYSATCSAINFFSPLQPTVSTGCNFATNSITSVTWNFGDGSSASNTSTVANPSHSYSTPGTYTVKLSLNYTCGTDTLILPVTAPGVSLGVAGMFTMCPGSVGTYTATGANSYSWSTGATTQTVTLKPSKTTGYTVTATGPGPDFCKTVKTFTVKVADCTGIKSEDASNILLNIYPNPTNGVLNVETEKDATIVIETIFGELLASALYVTGPYKVDLSSYKDGIYFVKVKSGAHSKIMRVVKIH